MTQLTKDVRFAAAVGQLLFQKGFRRSLLGPMYRSLFREPLLLGGWMFLEKTD